ncbi:cyclopropane-fatty-acyl-phospholipid synthase family protein [Brevundimonas sp.]|uniref:cyclopropane-fatty-acyl-phospholipid synthase family protein n=1 Tax=Brevundimonas sp. TaxID=1871086 RepID=UPI002AB84879|nr:cyclopropane-fatty-acyl-phospholipid synthase family protein [Brevundimonas sp.]MDZ4364249.1 cyclopropane-fatty-acyl-phospholipid synthase family protein [Brevundimonas sp.]
MSAVTVTDNPQAARTPPVFALLLRLLGDNWTYGRLTLSLPNGEVHTLVGATPGPDAVMTVLDYRFARRVLANGDIGYAEGYMAGEWDSPHLAVLLETLANNYDHIRRLFDGNAIMLAVNWISHKVKRNSRSGSKKNIHAHYDLGNAFYRAWLDGTMTYSSARFERADDTLEAAQTRKYASLARMMGIRPGQTVLEIGCGWGGFADYVAREIGAHVTGITISQEQHDFARQRLFNAGLSDRTSIQMVDYRDVQGRFDHVASIEMFEAVGKEYWAAYFDKINQVLAPGGRAGLQIITIQDELFEEYNARTDFIQKYVFPGGMLPSEARLQPVVEKAGLSWDAVERFGIDYADTLNRWDERFQASWADIRKMGGFDQRFYRLWRFYLGYCEAGFRSRRTDVIQLALTKA